MAKKVQAAITLSELEKLCGKDRALRVFQKIAIVGGHGNVSDSSALDPNGYDEKTAEAVKEILDEESKGKNKK